MTRVGPDSALRQPDGSIRVPAANAREVLSLLVAGLAQRAQRDGLPVSEAGRRLLWALADAADRHEQPTGSVVGTPAAQPAILSAVADIAAVAARMGCSEAYVRRLARQGRLDARKVGGRWIVNEGART